MARCGGAVLIRRRPGLVRAALTLVGLALCVLAPTAAPARDLLGVYGAWAAFRDPAVPRCYAIALGERGSVPAGETATASYADVGDWPAKAVRGRVHVHLAHRPAPAAPVTLSIGLQHVRLVVQGADAWAPDARADAAITAAMRSAVDFTLTARDAATGRLIVETWPLEGAASAMDAALVGCALPR